VKFRRHPYGGPERRRGGAHLGRVTSPCLEIEEVAALASSLIDLIESSLPKDGKKGGLEGHALKRHLNRRLEINQSKLLPGEQVAICSENRRGAFHSRG